MHEITNPYDNIVTSPMRINAIYHISINISPMNTMINIFPSVTIFLTATTRRTIIQITLLKVISLIALVMISNLAFILIMHIHSNQQHTINTTCNKVCDC